MTRISQTARNASDCQGLGVLIVVLLCSYIHTLPLYCDHFYLVKVLRVCLDAVSFMHNNITLCCHIGTTSVFTSYPQLGKELDKESESDSVPECNKDTGARKRIQKWSRGHFFVVRGGGHIDMWQPLAISVS